MLLHTKVLFYILREILEIVTLSVYFISLTRYRYLSQRTLREKCPKTEFFLARIFLYSDWIQENTDQKKLHIETLFMQWNCWKPRQENFLPSAAFLFKENNCNFLRLGKTWNKFNFFQVCKIDLWKKIRTAIEIIGIGILIKRLEEIKV